jgi:hypothetical protein
MEVKNDENQRGYRCRASCQKRLGSNVNKQSTGNRDWRALLQGENKHLDYKAASSWNDAKADLLKDIIAMSNIRDGGQIVIGVRENETKTHEPDSLTNEQLASFDPTDVVQYVNGFVQPGVRLNIVRDELAGQRVVRIEVAEFEPGPNICTRPAPGARPAFNPGQILIRTEAAQSRVIQTAEEMRELLGLALGKTSNGLLRDFRRVIEGRGIADAPPPDKHAALFAKWADERDAFVSRLKEKYKKEVGSFACSIVPVGEIAAIDDYERLRSIAEWSNVTRNAGGFPRSRAGYGEVNNRGGFIEGTNSGSGYEYEWRAFSAGPFVYVGTLNEDVLERRPEPYLEFDRLCRRVAMVFMFADRFFEQRSYDGELRFDFRWTAMRGRTLVPPDRDIWLPGTYKSRDPEIPETIRMTTIDVKTDWESFATALLGRVCQLFQVRPAPAALIRETVQRERVNWT